MLIQTLSQAFTGPLLTVERAQTATSATLVDHAVAAIATVKVFNTVPYELASLNLSLTVSMER
jgi:ATP-binding cassette subfamily B (MDR/TAP) protein 1